MDKIAEKVKEKEAKEDQEKDSTDSKAWDE